MSKRIMVSRNLADAVIDLDTVLRKHHGVMNPETRRHLDAALKELKKEQPEVSAEVAHAIGKVDGILRSEWAYNFSYHIVIDGKTAAGANIEKAMNAPRCTIKPKIHRREKKK